MQGAIQVLCFFTPDCTSFLSEPQVDRIAYLGEDIDVASSKCHCIEKEDIVRWTSKTVSLLYKSHSHKLYDY